LPAEFFVQCNFYALQMHVEFTDCRRYFMYIVEGFYLFICFLPNRGLYLWVFFWVRKTRIKCKFVPSVVCPFYSFWLLCCVLHCSPFVCHVSASGDNLYPYLEQVHLHTNGLLASTCVYLEYVYYYPKVKQVQMRVVNKALQIYISLLAVT